MTGDGIAALEGTFRLSRDATIDGLLELLQRYPSDRLKESRAGLRRRVQGVVLGLESLLVGAEGIPHFAEELGSTLFGISDGSDEALIAMLAYLEERFSSAIPPSLQPEIHRKLLSASRLMMLGWLRRFDDDADKGRTLAEAVRERVDAGADGDVVRAAVEQSPVGTLVIELATGTPVLFNRALEDLFGFTLEEDMTRSPEEFQNEDSADDDYDLLADMMAGRIPYVERVSARPHKNGHSVPFHLLAWPVRDRDGVITHLANHLTAAEGRPQGTAGSGLAEKRARYLLQLSPDPVIVAAEDGTIRYASPSVEVALGVDPDWLMGQHIAAVVSAGSLDAGRDLHQRVLELPRARLVAELEAPLPDGSFRWFEVIATNLLDVEDVQGIVYQGRDITVRRDLQSALERMARTEPLTGLLNRRGFLDRLRDWFTGRPALDCRGDRETVVCYIDLDSFKAINDRFGHSAGDAVLVAVATRLAALVDGRGFAGRMGGDEFVVLAECIDADERQRFRLALTEALQGTIIVDGQEIPFDGSAGFAAVGSDADPASVLRDADIDLTRAKQDRHRGAGES